MQNYFEIRNSQQQILTTICFQSQAQHRKKCWLAKPVFIRNTWLLLMLNISLCCFSFGQKLHTFSIHHEVPLTTVLSDISSAEDVLFAYPTRVVEKINIQPLDLKYNSLENLLSQLLDQTSLEMLSVDRRSFLLREKKNIIDEGRLNLEGQIVDSATGEGLPFSSIYSKDFGRGTMTDENGQYTINYDNPEEIFYVSFLGFDEVLLSARALQQQQKIELKQSQNMLDDVMIAYVMPASMVSENGQKLIINNKIIELNSGGLFGNDVMRNIQMVAGVAAHEDNSSALKIRGSNVEGSRIIFNGMTLYNVNHYYGIFSALNGDFIHKTELYKNTQPVQYSDTNGGLLVLKSCDDMSASSNIVRVNLLTTSAYFNNNLTDKIMLEIGGRTSYKNVNGVNLFDASTSRSFQFNNQGNNLSAIILNEPLFRFYDVNASLKLKLKSHNLAFNFFNSQDYLDNSFDRNILFNNINTSETIYSNIDNWKNLGFSIMDKIVLSSNKSIHTNFQYTDYSYNSLVESRLIGNQGIQSVENNNDVGLSELSMTSYFKLKNENYTVKTGVEINKLNVRHQLEIEDDKDILNYKDDIFYVTSFFDYQRRFENFIFIAGLRAPISKQKDKLNILLSPLISGAYLLNDNSKVKASYNYSNQILRELEYESRLGQNYSFFSLAKGKLFPILKTHKFMLGYDMRLGNIGFDLELYYKFTNGAMQLLSPLTGFDDNDNKPGTGIYSLYTGERRSYGMDLTLDYSTKKYTTWLAYTLSKSEDKYRGLFNGNYYLSQIDRRHQLKWINSYKLGKFDIGNNFVFASGRPYLPLEDVSEVMGKDRFDAKNFQRMLPAYLRVDLSIDYNLIIGKSNVQIGASVFNLTNRQNVKYIQYSHKLSGQENGELVVGTGGDLLDRTYNLNFNISF